MTSARSVRIFWTGFLALYAAGLTFLPSLFQPNYRIDVLHQLCIGREHVFGTYLFPAFSTWVADFVSKATLRADFAPFLAAALINLASIFCVYLIGIRFLSRKEAFYGTVATTAYWYFNMGSVMYNNNGCLTLFWILAIIFFYRALTEEKKRYWIATGLSLGLSLISKYPAIILVSALLFYSFSNRQARRFWRTSGPYLTIAFATMVFLPNFLFLKEHFSDICAYINSKKPDVSVLGFLCELFRGWGTQLLIAAPIVIVLLPFFKGKFHYRAPNKKNNPFDDYLLCAVLYPLAFQVIFQTASGIAFTQNSYGYPLWPLLGIMAFRYFRNGAIEPGGTLQNDGKAEKAARAASVLIVAFCLAQILSLPIQTTIAYYTKTKKSIRFFPGKAMAAEVDRYWAERFPDVRCSTVSSTDDELLWHYGAYSRFQPTVNDPNVGAWTSDETVNEKGGAVLWTLDDETALNDAKVPDEVKNRFPSVVFVKNEEFRFILKRSENVKARIGIGFIPPPDGAR